MSSQDATNDVLIDVDPEYIRELLGDMPAAESPISVLHSDDRRNELRRRAFRARPAATVPTINSSGLILLAFSESRTTL